MFTLFFIASSVFILCKVNQRQPQLPKPLRILYIVLGALLVLAGILVLLSLPGSGEPITAEDYWLVGCVLLGGGALLDIGIYNLGFLRILTGQDPEKVETKEVHINEYGTDDYSRLALTYPGGCKAESVQTIGQELERNARIVGTKGSIFLPDFQHAETMTLEVEGKEPEVIRCPVDINGFEYEIREASRCVKLGRTGSDRYTPQDSLALTRLMYDTRMSWGMKFAGEV